MKLNGFEKHEVFSVRHWNGDDHRRAAVFCLSRKNEILDHKDSPDSGRVFAQIRAGAHGTGAGLCISWENINCFL